MHDLLRAACIATFKTDVKNLNLKQGTYKDAVFYL